MTEVLSYDRGMVSSVGPTNAPATGKTLFTVSGANFGSADYSPWGRVGGTGGATAGHHATHTTGGTGCESTRWVSDTSLACKAPRGVSSPIPLSLTVGRTVSLTATDLFSYDTPSLTSLAFPNGPASGGASITILGASLGWLDLTPAGRIGGTPCEATGWLSDSSVACRLPLGTNLGHVVAVTVDGELATIVGSFSYNVAFVSGVAFPNGPATGGVHVTLHGASFGALDMSTRQRVGGTACEATTWVADSSVICKLPAGVAPRGGVPLVFTTSQGTSTVSGSFTYNRPDVTRMSATNSLPLGGAVVVLYGHNFGVVDYTPTAFVDYEACTHTAWTSDSAISCTIPPGYGTSRGVTVQVGGEYGWPFHEGEAFNYENLAVLTAYDYLPNTNFEFLSQWIRADSLSLADGAVVSSLGDSSGNGNDATTVNSPTFRERQVNDFPAVRLLGASSQRIVLADASTSEVAQAFGGGTFLAKEWVVLLVVRADIQPGATITALLSASAKATSDDYFSLRIALDSTTGIQEVMPRAVINANSAGGVNRHVTADAQWHVLALTQDGFGVSVFKDGTVDPIVLDHGLERAEGALPDYVRPLGGLDGIMGVVDRVEVGALSLSSATSAYLTGDVAELLVYRTGLTIADIDRVATYLAKKYALPWRPTAGPTVVTVTPSRGPAAGGGKVTVIGAGFAGATQGHLRAFMSGVECVDVVLIPYGGGVEFTVPPGVGFAEIEVHRDQVVGLAQGAFRYDPPEVYSVSPSKVPASGGSLVTISGVNFGRALDGARASVTGRDGSALCASTVHVSDSQVVCVTPVKGVAEGFVIVSVGEQSSRATPGASQLEMLDVPGYLSCPLDDSCRDCCLSKCQLAKVAARQATGKTGAECEKECYAYCRTMLRRASAPLRVRVGPRAPTGSTIPLMWDDPGDAGGDRVSQYLVSYTAFGQHEQTVAVSVSDRVSGLIGITGLKADTQVIGITVRAVTPFGPGDASAPIRSRTSGITIPSAPLSLSVTASTVSSVSVHWLPPSDDGGGRLSSYTVSYTSEATLFSVGLAPSSNTATLAGLPAGLAITGITVTAENVAGLGPASLAISSAYTQVSMAPAISSVGDASTLAGLCASHDDEPASRCCATRD